LKSRPNQTENFTIGKARSRKPKAARKIGLKGGKGSDMASYQQKGREGRGDVLVFPSQRGGSFWK